MEQLMNDTRWAAVVARDANADGQFYYSVKTMGVYCRPSCKSRLARRENVEFHESWKDAEKAGFRACKRCKPNAARAEIRYAVGASSLGLVLTAMSERGLCAILLGDDRDALVRDLEQRFPSAKLIAGEFPSAVVSLIETPGTRIDLPLDIRGTAFQQRVWQALREIPSGSTSNYAEIANRIGLPKSVRAVAQACGANALAVAIPCHRVVRSDGGLSGYRWGVERKRALLDREARG